MEFKIRKDEFLRGLYLAHGIGLGGGYKFLVFVSGVIIPVFAVTGFLMWWLKRRNRRAGERAKAAIQAAAAAD